MSKRLTVIFIVFLVLVFAWKSPVLWKSVKTFVSGSSAKKQRIYDYAGVLPKHDVVKFEQYLYWLFNESDVDIRFVFIKDTGQRTIEDIAVEKVQELISLVPIFS